MIPLLSQIILILLIAVLSQLLYLVYFSPLSQIPNAHFTSPLSGAWLTCQKFRGRENRTRLSAHERLGPVIRLRPREISINRMDYVEEIFDSKFFGKANWYPNGFRGWKSPILASLTDEGLHSRRRGLMATRYTEVSLHSSSYLNKILETRVENTFRKELQNWVASAAKVDIFQKSKACLMDVVSAWVYGIGRGTNFLKDENTERKWSMNLNRTFEGFVWGSEYYWLISALERLYLPILPWMIRTEESQRQLQDWSLEKCRESQASSGSDTQNSLLSHFHKGLENTEPTEEVESLCMDEMLDRITGQLPTGIIVTYAVWELTQNPEWSDRLPHELSKLLIENNLGSNSLSPIVVDKLPILNAVVMETLRLYSSNPGPWPRINLTHGTQLGERYYIPAGTTVGTSSYALHRNEKIFPQPNRWCPGRWLDADARQLSDMNRWFWAFGSGPYMCLGSHFAIIVIKSVIKVVYTDFKAEIVDDSGIVQVDAPIASLSGDKLLVEFVPAEKRG